MAGYRIISSDNHVIEPLDLWTTRMEPKFRDQAPHLLHREDGDWLCQGDTLWSIQSGSQTGVRFEDPDKVVGEHRAEKIRKGGYIPEEHVKDMDIDGVDVSIVYPTFGIFMFHVQDTDLFSDISRVYNDWAGEFCKTSPKRLKGVAMLNVDDVQKGIKELERCHKMGFAGALIAVYPLEDKPYYLPEYEPLWSAAEDLGVPLGLHAGSNRPGFEVNEKHIVRPGAAEVVNIDHWVRMSLANMIFSGVFERHPKLQVGAVECELSWIPHFLDRLDVNYTQRRELLGRTHKFKDDILPSDFFHRNVFAGFQEDAMGIRDRDIIGVDNLQWGSDYPHSESTWPRTREILDEILADCTEEEKAKIAGGNAARVYHLD